MTALVLPDPAQRPALLFDLDGTICDSAAGFVNSMRHAVRECGRPDLEPAIGPQFVGPPMHETMAALGVDGELAAQIGARYRERYDTQGWLEVSVFDGMPALLGELSAAGRTVAVATSKLETAARRILSHHGLDDCFDAICGADHEARNSKAAVIAYALETLALDPAREPVVMIGDRHHDIDGAAAQGIPTIGVLWGYGDGDELAAAAARVRSVDELRALIA